MQHNEYVLIMIEFFSKWLKSMPYLYHNNEGVAYAFINTLFSKFDTLVEISIDLSKTLCGEFQET
jgi:hypothetical protein